MRVMFYARYKLKHEKITQAFYLYIIIYVSRGLHLYKLESPCPKYMYASCQRSMHLSCKKMFHLSGTIMDPRNFSTATKVSQVR